MTMVEERPAAEVEDPAGEFSPGPDRRDPGGGLVLPEEVVASLAGQLAERARAGGPVTLTGPGGLLSGVIGQVLQAGLAAELDAHLDGGDGEANRRNGSSVKTLNTEVGPVRVAVPRDRDGSFDPVLVPKQARRSDGLDAVITSLYAKGMSVRDIARHVRQTTGVDLSHDTVSRVTDAALEPMREWQARPLERVLPGRLCRCADREGAGRVGGAEQGGEHRGGDRHRGRQARAGHLGRLIGGGQGVGAGAGATEEPGPGGSAVLLLRRPVRAG